MLDRSAVDEVCTIPEDRSMVTRIHTDAELDRETDRHTDRINYSNRNLATSVLYTLEIVFGNFWIQLRSLQV